MKHWLLVIGILLCAITGNPQSLKIEGGEVQLCNDCGNDNNGKKMSKFVVSAQDISIDKIRFKGSLIVEQKNEGEKKIVTFLPNKGQQITISATYCDTIITLPDSIKRNGIYHIKIIYVPDTFYTIKHDSNDIDIPDSSKAYKKVYFSIHKRKGYKFDSLSFEGKSVKYNFDSETHKGAFIMPKYDLDIETKYSRTLICKIVDIIIDITKPSRIDFHFQKQIYGGVGFINVQCDIRSKYILPEYCLGFEYRWNYRLSMRTNYQHSIMYGITNNEKNFKTNIFDYGLGINYYFIPQKGSSKFGEFHGIPRWYQRISSYINCQFDLLHFNPKGKIDGKWIKLQQFNTEGQGSGYTKTFYDNDGNSHKWEADKTYKLTTPSFALGLGIKYRLKPKSKFLIGAEISYHFTNTDYLDDVHSDYYFNYQDSGIISDNTLVEKNNIYRVDNIGTTTIKTLINNQNHQLGEYSGSNSKNNDNFFSVLLHLYYAIPYDPIRKFRNVKYN